MLPLNLRNSKTMLLLLPSKTLPPLVLSNNLNKTPMHLLQMLQLAMLTLATPFSACSFNNNSSSNNSSKLPN